MIPSPKPLLLVSLALILLLLAAGCMEASVGDKVPCSENIQIKEKWKQMNSQGNMEYIWSLSDGRIVQVVGYSTGAMNEVIWERAPIGVSGHLVHSPDYYKTIIGFAKQNVTQLSDGRNICMVIP